MTATLSPQIQGLSTRVKWVTFSIAQYRFGLAIESVLRVVQCPPGLKAQFNPVELIQVEQHTLTLINLKPVLQSTALNPARSEFLIVTNPEAMDSGRDSELYGLRVDTPPDVIEFDPAAIRQLPIAYREQHPLKIASQVAVLPQENATLAIFLLKMNCLLNHLHQ